MPTSEISLTPSAAFEALSYLIDIQQPAVLWGSPGIGKSDLVRQVGAAKQLQVIDIRTVLLDPVDLRGLPYIKDGVSMWGSPSFLPTSGTGILFLDEFNRAPAMVQNACLQLLLDRKLGEYLLPDGWTIVLACNRESDGGGVSKMNSAALNRLIHLHIEVSVDDWSQWAVKAGLEPMVYAFIRYRPELLHQFDRAAKAFPSPRSWSFVDRVCKRNVPAAVELPLIAGAVGHGAAIEFLAFKRLYKTLPNLDAILLNPATAPLPDQSNSATLWAVAAGLARKADANNFPRVMQYLNRLPSEYQTMAVKDATARDNSLCSCPEFIKWAAANSF